MTYASICDGIGAAHLAWQPLGWQCKWVSEIEPFPSAVVEHRWGFRNHGDFTKIDRAEHVRLLCGGTPCQSFSVAGQRGGVDDCRGQLTFQYVELALRLRPTWLVWENVPGVLSIDDGFVFAAFLSALSATCVAIPAGGWSNSGVVESAANGYGLAWRVLDAQFAGVPQRRRRVFVVGYFGDWRRAAAVLFERFSLSGYPPPRRKTRQTVAGELEAGIGSGRSQAAFGTAGALDCHKTGGDGFDDICMSTGQGGAEIGIGIGTTLNCNHEAPIVTHTLRGQGFDAREDGSGRGTPLVAFAIQERAISENPLAGPDGAGFRDDDQAYTIEARSVPQAVAFSCKDNGRDVSDIAPTLRAIKHNASHESGGVPFLPVDMAVRRLTPRECERLQGMPDDHTLVPYRSKPAADGSRYCSIGNSMAVPVMRWIGERIALVDNARHEDRSHVR